MQGEVQRLFTQNKEKELIIEQLLASTLRGDVDVETVLQEGHKHETMQNSIKHLQDRATGATSIDAIRQNQPSA